MTTVEAVRDRILQLCGQPASGGHRKRYSRVFAGIYSATVGCQVTTIGVSDGRKIRMTTNGTKTVAVKTIPV